MENPASTASNVFGASSSAALNSSSTQNQNPFAQVSSTNPIQGTTLFGKPASGVSINFPTSTTNVFGSQVSPPSFGGSFGTGTRSGTSTAPGFSIQNSFQSSVANQSSTFGSIGQSSTFPSSNLFALTASSSSSTSQNLFKQNVSKVPESSKASTTLSSGLNSSFQMQTSNPFEGGTSSSVLFSGSSTKPTGTFSTSTSASSSSNSLFRNEMSSVTESASHSGIVTAGTSMALSNSNFGKQGANPFGSRTTSHSSTVLFAGSRSEPSESGVNDTTQRLFGKPVQATPLFSGSQSQNATLPSKLASSFSSGSNSSSAQQTLFGKPQPQNKALSEGGSRDTSPSIHDVREGTSRDISQTSSQNVSPAFAESRGFHRSHLKREFTGPSTEQNTSVPQAQLFGKPIPSSEYSSNKINEEEINEVAELEERSPKKSLSKWRANRDTAGKRAIPSLSRRISKEQNLSRSLTVKNIPPEFNEKDILRNHFLQFGNVTLFRHMPVKNTLTLTFDSHESAMNAKKEGLYIGNGEEPLSIFLRATSSTKLDRDISKSNPASRVDDELQSMREAAEYEAEEEPVSQAPSSPRKKPEHLRQGQRRSLTPPPSTVNQKFRSDVRPVEHRRSQTPPPTSEVKDVATSGVKDLLKALRNARASNTTERISILDTRDKLLKLLRGRQQADLASAKAFVGTCPDMCPEKERYYREDIRRLALYEVIPSTMSNVAGVKTKVDHSRAVKEYSRSSADQEEPLPLELRPLPVLFDTMVYLLREVADLGGEGKWSEWYDFLWNRTRGIRKDITQQQLCSIEVAELLEKCARFHIFSSERLCEEDMMSFDDKINNENLTKCLQTLKELYADLETKQGIYCENEAEFRAYMALMKLNEGDTLREVQQLRPQIRESQPIKFAIRAHTALNSNNYVRFFRLIEETTFLNGCILHRYFNQIRSHALRIIKKAYKGTTSKFPVSEMIRLLRFENDFQVRAFCSYYSVEIEGSDIVLDSRNVFEPEGSLSYSRSPSLIECKQIMSVGETIYGGPLPYPQLPPPLSSFTEDGVFIFSAEFEQSLIQGGLKTQRGNAPSMQQKPPPPSAPKIVFSNELIRSTARNLIVTETDTETLSVVKEVIQEERDLMACIDLCLREVINETVVENIKNIVNGAITDEEVHMRQQLELSRQRQREVAMDTLSTDLLEEVQREIVTSVAQQEMSLIKRELHVQLKDRCCHACAGDLLETVMDELVEDIATDVYEVDVVARRELLNETERLVRLRRTSRWFRIWHKSHVKRVRVRRAMLDFPAAPKSLSHSDQISVLVPLRPSDRIVKNAFYIGERARLHVQSPMDVFRQDLHLSAQLSMASTQQMLFNIQMWQPIDLALCVGNQLQRAAQRWNQLKNDILTSLPIQWKLVLSLPKEKYDDSEKEQKFVHWTKARLSLKGGKSPQKMASPCEGEILSQYTIQLARRGESALKKSSSSCLSFSLRCFHGIWKDTQLPDIKSKSLLKGNSGIIFVTHTAEQLTEQKALWHREHKRLLQLFTEKSKKPALPLVVIIPRTSSKSLIALDSVKSSLKLDDLHRDGWLEAVHIAQPLVDTRNNSADVNPEWATQLTSCLRFLATHIPSPPCLKVKNVSDFVEDAVVEFYKAPVYHDLRTRYRHQMLHQSPNILISLYNDIIEHVAAAASSDSLMKFSWPAPEFDNQNSQFTSDWNSTNHLADVYLLITKLRLPVFRYSNKEKDDWTTLCQDVWSYMNVLTKADSGSAKITLFQQITEVLKSTKKLFDQFCWLASEDGPCEPSYVNMAWTDFIDACIHYKLVSLRTGHLAIELPETDEEHPNLEEDFKELLVHYHEEEVANWEAPLSWEDALRDTDSLELGQVKATIQRATARREESYLEKSNGEDDKCESESSEDSTRIDSKTGEIQSETSSNAQDTWSRIQTQFEKEKKDSERLESLLASAMDFEDLSNFRDGHNTLNMKDNTVLGSRLFDNVSTPLKRRRMSDDMSESLIPSSSLATSRANLPKSRFQKHRRIDNSDNEEEELGTTTTKENYLEEKVTKVLTSQSLSERFANFKRELEEERRADKLLEMKMSNWLTSHLT